MREFFFGQGAVVMWSLSAAIFAILAAYLWLIVLELGGLRGAMMAVLFTGCTITCLGFAVILSHTALIPGYVAGAIVSSAWPPMVIAAIILCDLYAADRNSHRSFTAKSYIWFKRVTKDDKEDRTRFTA